MKLYIFFIWFLNFWLLRTVLFEASYKRAIENATGCGFDSHLRKLNIQYFRFHALVKAKRGFQIRHSTRNAS